MIIIDMPLAVFASRFPKQYHTFLSRGRVPVDALFDGSFFVRVSEIPGTDESSFALYKKI